MNDPVRHIDIIYCDDIRTEIANKISLIGIYGGDMIVSSFPAVLPKLCIVITAVTDASDPFRKLSVKITKGEKDEARADLFSTGDVDVSAQSPKDIVGDGGRLQQAQIHVVLSPFQIDSPMIIRVAVETERETLRGRALSILPQPPQAISDIDTPRATQPSKTPRPRKRRPKSKTKAAH